MKTQIKFISIILIVTIGLSIIPQKTFARKAVSYQVFYDELSPYGTWVYTPYGYVWSPAVEPGFAPYATNGYWAFTDEGWTWVSNYPWGWAPFHYGRWYTDDTYGSIWIPGNVWGPGWVDWQYSGNYYGWAPLGPGMGCGSPNGYFYGPRTRWTYANGHHFGNHHNKDYHYYNPSHNYAGNYKGKGIDNFKLDKNGKIKYNAGPKKNEIEKFQGKKITPYTIKESDKPGQKLSNNQFETYKPQIQKNNTKYKKISPAKVGSIKSLKPSIQKNNFGSATQKNQDVKQKSSSTQKGQPVKQKTVQPKQTVQPTKQKTVQPKQTIQPSKQKTVQPKQNIQPNKQKQVQPRQTVQPAKQKQTQTKQNSPVKKGK